MSEREWQPNEITGKKMQEFAEWLNSWADVEKRVPNEKANGFERGVEAGYNWAVRDVFEKLKLEYVLKEGDTDE